MNAELLPVGSTKLALKSKQQADIYYMDRSITMIHVLVQAAEHAREVALREELMRLERLERMAEKFDKKASMRANWLIENTKLVSEVLSI